MAKRRKRRKKAASRLSPLLWQRAGMLGVLALIAGVFYLAFGRAEVPDLDQVGAVLSSAVDDLYGGGQLSPGTLTGSEDTQLQLHLIDVGQGLSVLVRTAEGSALIDAGDREHGETVADYLAGQGVQDLDVLIATHAHADHIGGMTEVVGRVGLGKVVMTSLPESMQPDTRSYLDLLGALRDKGRKITPASPGLRYRLGKAEMTVYGPVEEDYSDLNNTSVVTRITYGERSFLVMGDAEALAEEDLIAARRPLRSDVLIAGHHGSSTSSSAAFLDAVKPLYVGISCGEGNSYGHPHRETLEALEERDCAVLRTDIQGTVVFTTDGERIRVDVEREAA